MGVTTILLPPVAAIAATHAAFDEMGAAVVNGAAEPGELRWNAARTIWSNTNAQDAAAGNAGGFAGNGQSKVIWFDFFWWLNESCLPRSLRLSA